MSLNTAVRSKLLAVSGISSKVGTRVYPKFRAQNSGLPAIVLHKVMVRLDQHMGGPMGTQGHRVQADCHAKTKLEAEELARLVALALIAPSTTGAVEFQGGIINLTRDDTDDAAEGTVHVEMVDATVWVN